MRSIATSAATIPEAIGFWAAHRPDDLAAAFFERGEEQTDALTYLQLDRRARQIAANLIRRGQQKRPVLLVARSDLRFIEAFCGCLYAGAIAVPAPPPAPGRRKARFVGIARDCQAQTAIGTAPSFIRDSTGSLAWIDPTSNMGEALLDVQRNETSEVAMLQYTSGTTDQPRGVVLTHRNLIANVDMLALAFGVDEASRVFSWLPLFHDMGLIASLILSLRCGIPFGFMAPMTFLQRPQRWLTSVDRFRATISGAPDFAYDICARLPPNALGSLDLGAWTTAFCGAEKVRTQTITKFIDRFAGAAFRRAAFFPCYGLAEATVFVAGAYLQHSEALSPTIACGPPATGTSVRIVNPESFEELPDGSVGEVWVSGEHVGNGYRGHDSGSTFRCCLASDPTRTYLRTGDLGFLEKGRLFIQGRIKEIIVYRGTNIDPADLEATIANSHELFGRTGAAFAIYIEEAEQVVAVHEVSRTFRETDADILIEAALTAVAENFGLRLYDLILVKSGEVEKTTSGKIRRDAARRRYNGMCFQQVVPHRSLGRSQSAAS